MQSYAITYIVSANKNVAVVFRRAVQINTITGSAERPIMQRYALEMQGYVRVYTA